MPPRRRPRRRSWSSLVGALILLALGTQGWKEIQKYQSSSGSKSGLATKVFAHTARYDGAMDSLPDIRGVCPARATSGPRCC